MKPEPEPEPEPELRPEQVDEPQRGAEAFRLPAPH